MRRGSTLESPRGWMNSEQSTPRPKNKNSITKIDEERETELRKEGDSKNGNEEVKQKKKDKNAKGNITNVSLIGVIEKLGDLLFFFLLFLVSVKRFCKFSTYLINFSVLIKGKV